MSIKDQINHAANVTKWKTDQQMRILKAQNLIRELEDQIRTQKAVLADAALKIYAQRGLADEELTQICQDIDAVNNHIQATRGEIEAIKQEQPPEMNVFTPQMPSTPAYTQQTSYVPAPVTSSGLVCPQCGAPLAGRFCPQHGVEGVPGPTAQAD